MSISEDRRGRSKTSAGDDESTNNCLPSPPYHDAIDVTTNSTYGLYGSIDTTENTSKPPGSPAEVCKETNVKEFTYKYLLQNNSNYRYFLMSYLINKLGEWLTYLASISLIEEITMREGRSPNTLISMLILVKLLPNVLLMPFGGILADSYDRKQIQITLDLLSSCVVFVFLWSYATQSIFICLVANFLIEASSGLYVPSNQAMLPQLFGNSKNHSEELKKATVLYGMSWSLMAALGSSLGGVLVARFGIQGCFVIDSVTYLSSAFILNFGVKGNYNASLNQSSKRQEKQDSQNTLLPLSFPNENQSLLEEQNSIEIEIPSVDADEKYVRVESGGFDLFIRGMQFLFLENPLVGACALLKGSAALAYGAVDVLNVSFSARGSESRPDQTSLKLGVLFGFVGVGCILGSMITDAISDLSFPRRIAGLSLGGFCCMFVALFWMAATPEVFASLCASTVIRSIGSSIVWINSTLLVQKYTPESILGRVSSFDTGVALFAEAVSALGAGMLMDQEHISAEDLSLILGCVALWFFFFWSPLAFRF